MARGLNKDVILVIPKASDLDVSIMPVMGSSDVIILSQAYTYDFANIRPFMGGFSIEIS